MDWIDPVYEMSLRDLLDEYVEREEAAMLAGVKVDSIYGTQYPGPPLLEHLTSLTIHGPLYDEFLKDPRVTSYVLAYARQLKNLQLGQMMVNMDEAFTRQLIGAPLEKLDLDRAQCTDVTIDVLCQQPLYARSHSAHVTA